MAKKASSNTSLPDGIELRGILDIFRSGSDTSECDCELSFEEETLTIEASECDGNLATSEACRSEVIRSLCDQTVENVYVESTGLKHRYKQEAVELLSAAGRFIELLGDRDERLAELAASDPLELATELESRVDEISDIGVESGLPQLTEGIEEYEDILEPSVGLSLSYYYADQSLPDNAHLDDMKTLDTGSEVRIYEREDRVPLYQIEVIDTTLEAEKRERLVSAYELIAEGEANGERGPSRALEMTGGEAVDPVLTQVLEKHTQGYGILEDLFADPEVSDVYLTSPVAQNPVRIKHDGEALATNIRISPEGADALASRIRRTSGRAFSRATPTVDATANLENGTGVRIAGVTDPVADGVAFAFREQAEDRFTLPGLVKNGTLIPEVGGFLSIAVERNAAAMIAGTRGAGKTTLLGTLLYELTPATRTVIIEDTPELPVESLQSVGRDVQALRTGTGDGPEITPTDALRTALRLGDGALVVGEIRGEEAQVLYEAMRVGASANAVMGTIHGDGAHDVYERVVSDLGVEPSSFAATDLIVTCQSYRTGDGRKRRVSRVEEVLGRGDDVGFEPLYEIESDEAQSTGRIDRGESRLVDHLTGPGEEYATIRSEINERAELIKQLAEDGRTSPQEVAAAYAGRGIK
jgi:type IV secretory pathway ATPase VirB11/archaellum biosynthesis ATPase